MDVWFFKHTEKSSTCRANWNLIIYVIIQVSVFSLHPVKIIVYISAQPVYKYFQSFGVKYQLIPSSYLDFTKVVKRELCWNFDLSLNFKKQNVTFFTLVSFLFLVSFAILDSYSAYHSEIVAKKILKFLYLKFSSCE